MDGESIAGGEFGDTVRIVYEERTWASKGTNMDDVEDLLLGQSFAVPLDVRQEKTSLGWTAANDQRVRDPGPALVIIHSSTFLDDSDHMNPMTNVLFDNFMFAMSSEPARFLIYTRGGWSPGGNLAAAEAELRQTYESRYSLLAGQIEVLLVGTWDPTVDQVDQRLAAKVRTLLPE